MIAYDKHNYFLMRLSLGHKIFALVLAMVGLILSLLFGLTYMSLQRGFTTYLSRAELAKFDPVLGDLEALYDNDSGWARVTHDPKEFHHWLWARMSHDEVPPRKGAEHLRVPRPDRLGLLERVALLDAYHERVIGSPEAIHSGLFRPLHWHGQDVGFLALAPPNASTHDLDRIFLEEQLSDLRLLALLTLGLAAVLSFVFSRHLRAPIDEIVKGTRKLSQGDYATRISVARHDELGDLAHDFNTLASVLEENEGARRQWVADTSHELRTPLAVLRAQIEALQDGVHEPDERSLGVLHSEVMALNKLVGDLHELASSDVGSLTYRFASVELPALVQEVCDAFRLRFVEAGIALVPPTLPSPALRVRGDRSRLRQLLGNLLENSLRYTSSGEEARLIVTLQARQGRVVLLFEDTSPGVAAQNCERLFERFFRVDSSRSRASGGSGLGLAICRAIVDSHKGVIRARPSRLGGLAIEIELEEQR